MKFLFVFIFISCAHKVDRQVISDSKLDVLAKESMARVHLELSPQTPPNSHAELTNKLSQCYLGDIEKVTAELSLDLDKQKDSFWYWNTISSCYRLGQNYQSALFYLSIAHPLAKKPYEIATYYNNKAIILAHQGLSTAAVELLKKSISIDLKLATPRFNLTMIYLSFGLTQAANTEIQFLYEENKNDPSIHKWIALSALLDKNYKKADKAFQYYFSYLKSDSDAALLWGYTKGKLNNSQQIPEILTNHLSSPDNSQKAFANLLSKN